MEKFEKQLENSKLWSRCKFYEYIMMHFYEETENKRIDIDRDNLYYYNQKDIYAIFDIKNAKLYYFEQYPFESDKDYNDILGIKINRYIYKEVYSVKGGWQGDGTDYYVYAFTEEKGKEITRSLTKSRYWKEDKLKEDILECFKYNKEVNFIENGFYYYTKVNRTSDTWKKYHFTDDEATGYEVAAYDFDRNILYYYWTSI